jgi:tRNA (cmo5U34)-methyltransferase
MIDRARDRIQADGLDNVSFLVDDITQVPLEPCDLVTSYYTIQFVRPSVRQQLIDRIYQSLQWGGAFVLFEKVRGNDARFQDILTGLYTDYKLDQGYSADEIVAKSRSLKGVLEPFSSQGNIDLLRRAGFTDVTSIFKYICFEGFLAIK